MLSNLDHLKCSMIPGMFTQMESAFGASIEQERQVSENDPEVFVYLIGLDHNDCARGSRSNII